MDKIRLDSHVYITGVNYTEKETYAAKYVYRILTELVKETNFNFNISALHVIDSYRQIADICFLKNKNVF